MYSKDEIYQATKRVKKKKKFYKHLTSFVSVNIFFLFLNLLTSPGELWFFYPMMGWGLGLIFHYVDTFGIPGFGMLDKEWEKREVDIELRKITGDDLPELTENIEELSKEEELKLKELRKNYDDSDFV